MLKPTPIVDQLLQSARQHHQAGRLSQAEALYREVLRHNPRHADALHLSGVIADQLGRGEDAVNLIRLAIAVEPNFPQAYGNVGNILRGMGRLEEAVAACRAAIALKPDYAQAHVNLGSALYDQHKIDEAVAAYHNAIALNGGHSEAYSKLGVALKDRGQIDEAIAAYHRAIALKPELPDAYNNLGIALKDKKQFVEAVAAFRRVIALKPDSPDVYNHLGVALHGAGKLDEAIAACRQAIALKPDHAEAYCNLGVAFHDLRRTDEAIAAYRKAIALRPDLPAIYSNLGNALRDKNELDEAVAVLRQAIALKPNLPEARNNLGNVFYDQGRMEDAIGAFRQAIALNPEYAEAFGNLGNALTAQGRMDDAITAYRRAIALRPDYSEAYSDLGVALTATGQLDEAIAVCEKSIALNAGYPRAYNSLANALKEQGELGYAIATFRQAVILKPGFTEAHSNLAYSIHYHPKYDAEAIAQEQRRWNLQQAEPLRKFIHPHVNDRNPERRLRIGYVSPDFRNHAAGLYLFPLIREHDRERFHITCYGSVAIQDEMTEQFRKIADDWRDIKTLKDERVPQLIRDDRVDILVDTTMHMGGTRLLLFARKPAPVQATFCAYPSTTGLATMDYRLTDPWLDPENGTEDALYVEQSIRLPDTFWCYEPRGREPAVGPLPAEASGTITFGCLNNFCKINEQVLAIWAGVLREVAGSRMLLLAPCGSARRRVLDTFGKEGIPASRIEFVGFQPRASYLETYHRIDICLDTFPYNGHWTTLDASWMGVPVVSLVGRTAVGRGGLSILSNLGLGELAARSEEQYVQIASDLAGDLPRLSALRSTLRQRMERSPLMDAPRFARNIEGAYRQMWRQWCAEGASSS